MTPPDATTSPRHEIAQVRGDGGRADVDREAEDALMQPGPHADDLLAGVHRDRHLPLAAAQRRLQVLQHRHRRRDPSSCHSRLSAAISRRRSPEGSCMSGCSTSTSCSRTTGIELDVARIGLLAHHLAMHLAAAGTSTTTSPSTRAEQDSRSARGAACALREVA